MYLLRAEATDKAVSFRDEFPFVAMNACMIENASLSVFYLVLITREKGTFPSLFLDMENN